MFDALIGESSCSARRWLGEVGILDLHRDRLAAEFLGLAVGPNLFRKRPELLGREIKVVDVGGKRIFRTHRLRPLYETRDRGSGVLAFWEGMRIPRAEGGW